MPRIRAVTPEGIKANPRKYQCPHCNHGTDQIHAAKSMIGRRIVASANHRDTVCPKCGESYIVPFKASQITLNNYR